MYLNMIIDGTINIRYTIYTHVYFLSNGYTRVSKGIPKVNHILHTGTYRKKIITIDGCIHSTMIIRIPTHWDFVDKMKYTHDRTTRVGHGIYHNQHNVLYKHVGPNVLVHH